MEQETYSMKERCPTYKVLVLEPEEIRRHVSRGDVQPTNLRQVEELPSSIVYSTGIIDWAYAEGLEIYVLTPQPELRIWDHWWLEYVPREHVLLGPPHGAKDDLYHIRPWEKMLEILKLSTDNITNRDQAKERMRSRVIFGDQIVQ